MMRNAKFLVLFSLIIVSCRTPSTGEIARFNNRPQTKAPCISNGNGTCFRDGELFNTTNMLCGESDDYLAIESYIDMLERYRYFCKKYNRCD